MIMCSVMFMNTDIRTREKASQLGLLDRRTRDPRPRPQPGGQRSGVAEAEDRETADRRQMENLARGLRPLLQEMLVSAGIINCRLTCKC